MQRGAELCVLWGERSEVVKLEDAMETLCPQHPPSPSDLCALYLCMGLCALCVCL